MGLYSGFGGLGRGTYTRGPYGEELNFLSFFQYKARIFAFSRHARCEISSKLTIKTPEYVNLRIKLKIKAPFTLFWPLYCYL